MVLLSFRTLFRAVALLVTLLVLYTIQNIFSGSARARPFQNSIAKDGSICTAYPDHGDIAIAIKTRAGAVTAESLARVSDTFSCLKPSRLLFFSDLEQTIGNYHLHDIISSVTPSILQTHADFEFYRQQRQAAGNGHDVRDYQKSPVLRPDGPAQDQESYKMMEKYRILHMIEKVHSLQPDMKWYVFIDMDTFVSWPNLVRWLRGMDHTKKRYLGHRTDVLPNGLGVAHEEAGIVLSGPTVEVLAMAADSVAKRWDKKATGMASGSQLLATALWKDLNVNVSDSWPLTIGKQPAFIPFQQEIWCEPLVAIPSVDDSTAAALLDTEQALLKDDPNALLNYAHLFNHMSENADLDTVDMWDNGATLAENGGYYIDWNQFDEKGHYHLINMHTEHPNNSPSACAKACNNYRDCVQYSYMEFAAVRQKDSKTLKQGGICHLSNVFRLGKERPVAYWDEEDEEIKGAIVSNTQLWSSGWNLARFRERRDKTVC